MFSYLASPYTDLDHDPRVEEFRFDSAMNAVCWLLDNRGTVYSPIAHFHPIARTHHLPKDIQFWRNHNLNMLLQAKELLILQIDGWDKSIGVGWEFSRAEENNLPISFVIPVEAGETRGSEFRVETFP